jgi:Ca2+/H+ antiporter, TMEM165/GDT1 family
MIDWAHTGPSIVAAFLASLVEFVEALTVVLAVGIVRGWLPALTGACVACGVLAALIVGLGPMLQAIPLYIVQLVVGVLLLMFGMRWLRKAILRSAGIIPLHDEEAVFASETRSLKQSGLITVSGWDAAAITASFKIVMLEGIEVVFIVVAIGATSGSLVPPAVGAGIALVAVVLLGVILHRPLAVIPENALKFAVGVLLCAFGTFWTGEGIGIAWPGEDWSILALITGFLVAAGGRRAHLTRQASHPCTSRVGARHAPFDGNLSGVRQAVRRRRHACGNYSHLDRILWLIAPTSANGLMARPDPVYRTSMHSRRERAARRQVPLRLTVEPASALRRQRCHARSSAGLSSAGAHSSWLRWWSACC